MSWNGSQREAFDLNRGMWDDRVGTHWASKMYSRHADDLRAGGHCLPGALIDLAGDVAGKSLVHLQCHMGMETLSWSRLGARAVGVDFSAPALERAAHLRDELGFDTRFVQSNVYDAVDELGAGGFDRVFVSVGSLCWLPDVPRWAEVVGALLKPGGRLVMNEGHPVCGMLGQPKGKIHLEPTYTYFSDAGLVFEGDETYVESDQPLKMMKSVEWSHPIGEVVTSLIKAGLVIDLLDESPDCCWPAYPMMQKTGDETWELPKPMRGKVPMMYTLTAHKR